MADYFGTLFISKLPFCHEKMEMINGVEKQCLVIPCDEAQMVRSRNGSWALKLQINEIPVNPQMRTNKIALGYRDMKELDKAKRLGYYEKAAHLGFMYLRGNISEDKKNDYTNKMTPIFCNGKLFLDSFQDDDIKTDRQTGRKYIEFSFRKSRVLDSFGNSHELIVKDGASEHQIGVAKEIPLEAEEQIVTVTKPNNTAQATDNKAVANTDGKYSSMEW